MQKINLAANTEAACVNSEAFDRVASYRQGQSSRLAHPAKKTSSKKRILPWWGWLITVIFALATILLIAAYIVFSTTKKVVFAFQAQVSETYFLAKQTYDVFKTQDLTNAHAQIAITQISLAKTKTAFNDLESTFNLLGYKQYYQDGLTLFTAAEQGLALSTKALTIIEPYSDLLGFGETENPEGGTAEDRVKKLLDTLEVLGPELDQILTDLEKIQALFNSIKPENYPVVVKDLFLAQTALEYLGRPEVAEMPVRAQIAEAQDMIDLAITTFKEYRPLIDQLPEMMGARGQRRKYLILFQNNNELRPTGGFLTAYSIVFIEDGKVTPEKSDDIYELDKKFAKRIPIPAELGKYLTTEKYWNLRDMNIDPDFKRSMDQFLANYKEVKGEPQDIDGIIAIDTKVLVDLVEILGPVEVPGYGVFSAEPDQKYEAPQIVVALSEIITRPVAYIKEDRKGILGPMMKSILEKTYGAGKETFPALFQIMLEDIQGRHIQAYFLDETLQAAAEKINLAGRLTPPPANTDFLAIVDANLGGAKSNLFIDYDVIQTILPPEAGTLTKRVVLNYRNSRPGDNCNLEAGLLCLNATNNDWNRLYLPLGAQLISAKGYRSQPTVYEENGFTVIDGFFALNPNSSAKIDLEYTIPYSNTTDYQLQIWQQGGLRNVKHLLDVNENQEEVIVKGDLTYQTKF